METKPEEDAQTQLMLSSQFVGYPAKFLTGISHLNLLPGGVHKTNMECLVV